MSRLIWLLTLMAFAFLLWWSFRETERAEPAQRVAPDLVIGLPDDSAIFVNRIDRELSLMSPAGRRLPLPLPADGELVTASRRLFVWAHGDQLSARRLPSGATLWSTPANDLCAADANGAEVVIARCLGRDIRVERLDVSGLTTRTIPIPRGGRVTHLEGNAQLVGVATAARGVALMNRETGLILNTPRKTRLASFCLLNDGALVNDTSDEVTLISTDGKRELRYRGRRHLLACARHGANLVMVSEEQSRLTLHVGERQVTLGSVPSSRTLPAVHLAGAVGPFITIADGRGPTAIAELSTPQLLTTVARSGAAARARRLGPGVLSFPGLLARIRPSDGALVGAVRLPSGAAPSLGQALIWTRFGALDAKTFAPVHWWGPHRPTQDEGSVLDLLGRSNDPRVIADLSHPIRLLAQDADGTLMALRGNDRQLARLSGEPGRVSSQRLPLRQVAHAAASASGKTLLVSGPAGDDGAVKVLVSRGDTVQQLARLDGAEIVALGCDDALAAVRLRYGDEPERQQFYDLPSGARVANGPPELAYAMAPARTAASASAFPTSAAPPTRQIGHGPRGAPQAALSAGAASLGEHPLVRAADSGNIGLIQSAPDGRLWAGYDHANRLIRVWDPRGVQVRRFAFPLTVTSLTFSQDSARLWIGDEAGLIRYRELQ